jgi:hypothetical protein
MRRQSCSRKEGPGKGARKGDPVIDSLVLDISYGEGKNFFVVEGWVRGVQKNRLQVVIGSFEIRDPGTGLKKIRDAGTGRD